MLVLCLIYGFILHGFLSVAARLGHKCSSVVVGAKQGSSSKGQLVCGGLKFPHISSSPMHN